MTVTVIALMILVQIVQTFGDWLARRTDKRESRRESGYSVSGFHFQ